MRLIISEKPSTAKTIAAVVGAAEKEYDGEEFCYKGNGYYVVNARGHLYSLGMPEDYGYSKAYKLDELPMFPTFELFPECDSTNGLRRIIGKLINLPEVESIICATDAGREGELIFRHIYHANKCTKPVYRLWCNSMTDEAIRKCLDDLPSDSNYDGEYEAALAREQSDWIIGMNLSRLYGVMDNYPHRVGRVKTPVLSIIVERDKEIEKFSKTVSYRLEMDNGAISEKVYSSREEAENVLVRSKGTDVNVRSAITENKSKNRPFLHSLTTLQQEANRVYGYTAKEVLEAAQGLYEKKFTTYPRTDCNYISEDMKGKIIKTVSNMVANEKYSERCRELLGQGLNFDSRVVNDKAMEGHDHHAIIPEDNADNIDRLTERERNVYHLIVNRLLCAVDKPYTYTETNYEFWCNDVTYKLKTVKPLELGWKAYDTDADNEVSSLAEYSQGSTFAAKDIHIKECKTQPPKHYTDASLLSVMNNIDNRIDDEGLKAAVKGKGIGTEATRADVIEQLIEVGYYIANDITEEAVRNAIANSDKLFMDLCALGGTQITEVEFAQYSQTEGIAAIDVNIDEQTMHIYGAENPIVSFKEISGIDEISDALDLENNTLTFSVVTIDDEEPFVVGNYVGRYDITALDEYQDYIERTGKQFADVNVEFYQIGGDSESVSADDKECAYISEHLQEVMEHSDALCLESESYSIETPQELLGEEETEQEEVIEHESEIEWTPIPETADDNGNPTSYAAKYNDETFWISENSEEKFDIEEEDSQGNFSPINDDFCGFMCRGEAEQYFEENIGEYMMPL